MKKICAFQQKVSVCHNVGDDIGNEDIYIYIYMQFVFAFAF